MKVFALHSETEFGTYITQSATQLSTVQSEFKMC